MRSKALIENRLTEEDGGTLYHYRTSSRPRSARSASTAEQRRSPAASPSARPTPRCENLKQLAESSAAPSAEPSRTPPARRERHGRDASSIASSPRHSTGRLDVALEQDRLDGGAHVAGCDAETRARGSRLASSAAQTRSASAVAMSSTAPGARRATRAPRRRRRRRRRARRPRRRRTSALDGRPAAVPSTGEARRAGSPMTVILLRMCH